MLRVYHSIGKTYVQSLPLELVVGEVVGAKASAEGSR